MLTKLHIQKVDSPFWAFAIHDGHLVDPSLTSYLKINESERLREEDPYTALMAELPINQFIVASSRFQLDLNRKILDAVYLKPEQAWGLTVWKEILPAEIVQKMYAEHILIYKQIEELIDQTIQKFGYFVLYDIHSYNCKREGPTQAINKETDPEINLGTAHIDPRWQELIQNLKTCISRDKLYNGPTDIRENIKFKGGYLSQRINKLHGDKGCVISFEFRKDFMDEWTATPDLQKVTSCKQVLLNSIGVLNKYFGHDRKE